VACSSITTAQPAAAPAASTSASPVKQGSLPVADYRQLARKNIAALANRTDEQLDTIGSTGCMILANDEGGWVKLIKILTDAGLPAADAGTVSAMIVYTFCPEQSYKLPDTLIPDAYKE
jgi:hypothetical protein